MTTALTLSLISTCMSWLILFITLLSVGRALYKYFMETSIGVQRCKATPAVEFFTELAQGRSIGHDKKLFSMLHSSILLISERSAVRGMSRCVSDVYGPLVSIDLSSCLGASAGANGTIGAASYISHDRRGFTIKDCMIDEKPFRAFEGYGYFQKYPGVPISLNASWLVEKERPAKEKIWSKKGDNSSNINGSKSVDSFRKSCINKRPFFTSAASAAEISSSIREIYNDTSTAYTKEDFVVEKWSIFAFNIEPPPNSTLDWLSYCIPGEFDKFGDKFIMSLFSSYPQYAHTSMLGALKGKYTSPWVLAEKVFQMEKAVGGLKGRNRDYMTLREKREQRNRIEGENNTNTAEDPSDICSKELDYTLTKSYTVHSVSPMTGKRFASGIGLEYHISGTIRDLEVSLQLVFVKFQCFVSQYRIEATQLNKQHVIYDFNEGKTIGSF